MASCLIDTNVVLRLVDDSSSEHEVATLAIERLLRRGDICHISAQVLIEFWSVATRPVAVNGLGWSPDRAKAEIEALLSHFSLLEETASVFEKWFQLVRLYESPERRYMMRALRRSCS